MDLREHKILTAGCTQVPSWRKWYLNLRMGRFGYRKREVMGMGKHSILQSSESMHLTAVGF